MRSRFHHTSIPRASESPRRLALMLVVGSVLLGAAAPTFARETRTYVVHKFVQAANSEDGDCGPKGPNEDADKLYARYLAEFGKSPQEVKQLITGWISGGPEARVVQQMMVNRGRIDGEPVNAYTHPAAVRDPQLRTVIGKYGYGFNLDDKVSPDDFTDPQTHETGIDHAMFRAVGCNLGFRGTLGNESTYWAYNLQLTGSEPAWLISITGDDLNHDGPVTLTFNRSYDHLQVMANGNPLPATTYRVDPDPRSQNVIPAHIESGVLSFDAPVDFHIQWNPLVMPELKMTGTRMRMQLKPDGTLEALMGGYQPWTSIYWAIGEGGYAKEEMIVGDVPGLYYTLKKFADADPDPQTGQNRAISVAYHFVAVPAFHAPAVSRASNDTSAAKRTTKR